MEDNKVNSGLLEFSDDQKVFVALDAETGEVKKAVTIDGDGVETDITGEDVTVEALNVTENGTYSEEGKAYSPVVVEVESDYSIAEVTVTNNLPDALVIETPLVVDGVDPNSFADAIHDLQSDESTVINVILYKGVALFNLENAYSLNLGIIEVTGDIEYNDNDGLPAIITGNGTITVNPDNTNT